VEEGLQSSQTAISKTAVRYSTGSLQYSPWLRFALAKLGGVARQYKYVDRCSPASDGGCRVLRGVMPALYAVAIFNE